MLNLQPNTVEGSHQTPVKRKGFEQELNTAESDQPSVRSLEDVDARDLFEKFEQMVRVTVEEENFGDEFEEDVSRQLNYEMPHARKLTFDPKTSSMKKKPRAPIRPFQAINLFQVTPPSKAQMLQGVMSSPERGARMEGEWIGRAAKKQRQQL